MLERRFRELVLVILPLVGLLSACAPLRHPPTAGDEKEIGRQQVEDAEGSIGACGGDATLLVDVQGSGAESPMLGQWVVVEGVVTIRVLAADGRELAGFFLQHHVGDQAPPGQPRQSASDAIFVVSPSAGAESFATVGGILRLTGEVAELDGMTALERVTAVVECGELPSVSSLMRVLSLENDLEPYEGALVRIEETLTVVDSFELNRNGRLTLAAGGRPFSPTNSEPVGLETLGLKQYRFIDLDDGRLGPVADRDLVARPTPIRLGDELVGLIGVLAEENGVYLVHPLGELGFVHQNPRPGPPAAAGDLVRVAAVNLHNYFTTYEARGARDPDQLTRQETKLVAAMNGLDAAIVGLVELENNQAAEHRLTEVLNRSAGHPYSIVEFAPWKVAGTDRDAIRVGMIYRGDLVEPVGEAMVDASDVLRRPLLAQAFHHRDRTFVVVVAHLKAKGCGDAEGADLDQGDGQGCWNDLRVRQAQRISSFVEETKARSRTSDVVVIGDLNSYAHEDPIIALRLAGLVDEIDRHRTTPAQPYSFVFRGRLGLLDYAMTTPNLSLAVRRAEVWHINADELVVLDYSSDPSFYRPTPYRSSDHDPIFIDFDFGG